MNYEGVWVPLVTPFRDGRVDLIALGRVCEHLLAQGVGGFVACGTTGEAPTLTEAERGDIIGCAASLAPGAVAAGTGAISTAETIRLTDAAAQAGASAALVISPPFLLPSQAEIESHFRAVADVSPLPVLIYNFPARTGGGVAPATALALAAHPNIVGTKQSVAAVDPDLQEVIHGAPPGFAVLCGSSLAFWPALAVGAHGGVLAAAHLEAPCLIRIFDSARSGDLAGAAVAHHDIWPRLAAIEGPAAIKRRLYDSGLIASAEMRPPLIAV